MTAGRAAVIFLPAYLPAIPCAFHVPSLLLAILFILALPSVVRAQAIDLDVEDVPVRDALVALGQQAGIDLVFAESTVEGHLATCDFEGIESVEALACVLDGTGLRAERVRRKQYVIVSRAPGEPEHARTTLSGFVVDAETSEALPGAHVYLPDLRIGTITNEAGYFALPSLPRGAYRTHITYVGFESVERRLSGSEEPHTIPLAAATVEGGTIVVEDESSNQAGIRSLPGLVTEPIGRLASLPSFPGESDLFQALQWFPGVRNLGEVNGGMSIRGASPDQNLYLIDGAPVYHPWHAFSLISTFQTETFKDIKLYRGSFPAQFGGRIASVLDAQMKDGSRSDPHATVSLSALSGRFVVETPATRNSSFMIAGRRSYLDKLVGREHPVVGEDGVRDTLRTGYYFYDASAKYTWRASRRDRVSISYYHGADHLDLRLPFDLSLDFSSWLRPADLFFEVDHRWQNRLVTARYQRVHSDRTFVTATAYYSAYDATERAFLRPTSSATLRSDYLVDVKDVGFKLDGDYIYSLSHEIQFGFDVVMRDFDSALDATVQRSPGRVDIRQQISSATEPEVAVFAQDVWTPTDRWTLRPGMRLSIFGGGMYAHVSPSMSFQYAVHPKNLLLKAGVGHRVQYMHRLRDRHAFTYDLVSSRWVPAGAQVRPASAVDVSGGFESRPFDGFMLAGDAFWRTTDNVLLPEDAYSTKSELVGPGIGLSELLGQYVEGEARAYGIELTTRLSDGPWSLWVSYAGGRSLTRSEALGEQSFRSARYDVPRSLHLLGSRDLAKWRLSAALDLRSGYPNTVPVSRYAVGDPLDGEEQYLHRPYINNGRLPPYFRIDLSALRRFELLGADWQARLHVYNVTNRRNVVARQYVPADDGMDIQNRRGLPILPLFEIEMQL